MLAACTSETISGSGLRLVISQPDAALYIQPPTLDTSVAVQITANAGWRNGAAKDVAFAGDGCGRGLMTGCQHVSRQAVNMPVLLPLKFHDRNGTRDFGWACCP